MHTDNKQKRDRLRSIRARSLLRPFLILRIRDHRGRKVMPARGSHHVTGREKAICVLLFMAGLLPVATVMTIVPFLGLPLLGPGLQDSRWWSMAAVVGGVLAGVWLEQHFFWRRLNVPTLLRSGQCAACEYALQQLPPEPDGCTVCPECGAAWRLDGEGTKGQGDEGTEGSEIGRG